MMSFRPLLAATLMALLVSQPLVSLAEITIQDVTVVDPILGTVPHQRVVIQGDTILQVGPADEPGDPIGEVIDGRGRFLAPGLWDMHVHFIYDSRFTDIMADLFLDYGITSVRDTGGDIDRMLALRNAIRASGKPAPSIYLSGPLLDGEHVVYDGGDPGRPPLGTQVATPAMAAQRVAELKAKGADFIKIYELVTPDVFAALVDAAAQNNLPVASHVPLSLTADTAGPRVGTMEHLRNVELACASNWKALLAERRRILGDFEGRGYDLRARLHQEQRVPAIEAFDETRCRQVLATLTDTIQVPTLRLNTLSVRKPFRRGEWQASVAALPAMIRDDWQSQAAGMEETSADPTFSAWSLFLVGLMHQLDLPMGAGTDTPIGLGVPGESLHHELELLVASGLSTREALYAATVQPARFLGLEASMGQVRAGMAADLVLLEANPLINISHTRRIERVMKAGQWVR